MEFVGHPTRKKSFHLRLPCEPHDGPQDAIDLFPPALYMTGSRDCYRLRPAMKKDGTRAATKLKGETFAAWEYAYEERPTRD